MGAQLAAIDWYNGQFGYTSSDAKTLAICYTNGRCQLMRNEADESWLIFFFVVDQIRLFMMENKTFYVCVCVKSQ